MTYKKKDKRNSRRKIKISKKTTLFIQPWSENEI